MGTLLYFHKLKIKYTGRKEPYTSPPSSEAVNKLTNGRRRFSSTGNNGCFHEELYVTLCGLQKHISVMGSG